MDPLQDPCFNGFSLQQVSDALCDGEFLATKSWTQEEVEEAFYCIARRINKMQKTGALE